MMAPIDHSVAELLFFLAQATYDKSNTSDGYYFRNVSILRPELLEVVKHSDELGLTEHSGCGTGLDWPYLRLTAKGREVVEEAIAAMREVT